MKKSTIGYLYVMRLGETGFTKVGISRDPARRARQFFQASVVYQSPCLVNPREAERQVLGTLRASGYAVEGEAARVDAAVVIEIAGNVVKGAEQVPAHETPPPTYPQSVVLDGRVLRLLDKLRLKMKVRTRGDVICAAIMEKAMRDLPETLRQDR